MYFVQVYIEVLSELVESRPISFNQLYKKCFLIYIDYAILKISSIWGIIQYKM